MWRIIEILKYFQYSCCVSIDFLTNKFNITIRTLQRNIVFINQSLLKISDCKISKKDNQFIFNGTNKNQTINILLAQFIQATNEDDFIRMSNLFLTCVWQKKYITIETFSNLTNISKSNLKRDIVNLNNFCFGHRLKIHLQFKQNKGFKLVGCEQHLRFIATSIIMKLCNYYNNFPLIVDKILTYTYQTIKSLMISSGYKKYYNEQLAWFLAVAVRRIKFNFFLEKNKFFPFNIKINIKNQINNLMLIIAKEFNIKFDDFETNYFNFMALLNIKINNKLFPEIITEIKKITYNIFSFMTSKYQISLVSNISQKVLITFLINNWFKLLFNYYDNLSFGVDDTFEIESKYQWGKQLFLIIDSQLKKHKVVNINFLENKALVIAFNNNFIVNKNWKVILYIFSINNSHLKNQITCFINATFPAILIKNIKSNLNNTFKLHLINQNFSILIKKTNTYKEDNLGKYKNIALININERCWNYQLERNINEKIKWLMLRQIQQAIIVFNFYTQEKFYNIKMLLWSFQNNLIKKYRLYLN